MSNEKEFLLNELREHTEDCDCAKSQHFYDEKRCKKKGELFKHIQASVFLVTIATYVLIVSGIKQNMIMNYIGIGLAMASTLLEILSHMLRFEEEAAEHWKSAQVYSELYRKCQFFYSDHMDDPIEVWREKLNDISEELSRISLLSPSVSKKSYDEWAKNGYEKKYPVHKAIYDLKTDQIKEVLELIEKEFKNEKIEIFLYGSYLSKMLYNDIDIAVILHSQNQKLKLTESMNKIEQQYSVLGLDLDITIITEEDFIANRCTQFIINVSNGECYYRSPGIKKSIKDYNGILTDYREMVSYFIDEAEKSKSDYSSFVSKAFYVYYHAFSELMSIKKIPWYGEKSLISESEYYASNNDCDKEIGIPSEKVFELLRHARLFFDEKETIYLINPTQNNQNNLSKLISYFDDDKPIINRIVSPEQAKTI